MASTGASLSRTGDGIETRGAGEPLRILYVSHGAAIREFIQALIHERSDSYDLDSLPEEERNMLLKGEKRIGNCARTVIELNPTTTIDSDGKETTRWRGTLRLYADDSHFVDSSRAPSPRLNADVL